MTNANYIRIPEIPQSGASFQIIIGRAQTAGQIFLAPGDGVSMHVRQCATELPLLNCTIRGDVELWRPAPSPNDFHRLTVRWMIDNASHIAVWSAPYPTHCDEVAQWGMQAAEDGARFILTIETTPERAESWLKLINRWKRRRTAVRVFGPSKRKEDAEKRIAHQAKVESYMSILGLL